MYTTYVTRSVILGTKEEAVHMGIRCDDLKRQYSHSGKVIVDKLLNYDISSRLAHIPCILFVNTKAGQHTSCY
jgi:hypothetical protein